MLNIRTLGRRERLFILVGGALLLPAILVLALQFRATFTQREQEVRQALAGRAEEMIVRADARLRADFQLLRLLASTPAFYQSGWAAARQRAATVAKLSPGWKAVTLTDRISGRVLFDTTERNVAGMPRTPFSDAETPREPTVVGVEAKGRHCPCVVLRMRLPMRPDQVLTAFVDPQAFQEILASPLKSLRAKPAQGGAGKAEFTEAVVASSVKAIVDRDGRYVARSIAYPDSIGAAATVYIRDAITLGGDGFYAGNIYSGRGLAEQASYAAYATSAFSGWSAHVAADRREIDGPRSGSTAAMLLGAIVLLVISGGLVVQAMRDLAAREEEEERLIQSQKAEAIGQFTGMVVHDFRNLLAAVQSGLNQIGRQTKEEKTLQLIELTRGALDRGVRLTNQLLSFARNERAAIEPVDLQALLSDLEDLLRKSLGGRVRLEISVAPDARSVYGNLDQLELAFVNLAVNARDAMEGEGAFSITVAPAGESVELRFADTGPGVPDSVRARLFEPLVTTKPVGKGTGLGLAQVAGAARDAGGEVAVETAEGGGAVFVMRLRPAPRAVDAAPGAVADG